MMINLLKYNYTPDFLQSGRFSTQNPHKKRAVYLQFAFLYLKYLTKSGFWKGNKKMTNNEIIFIENLKAFEEGLLKETGRKKQWTKREVVNNE